jgi:ankyrin repeat protein
MTNLFLLSFLLAVTIVCATERSECPAAEIDNLCNGVQSNEFSQVSAFLGKWSEYPEVLNSGICGGLSPLALAAAMGHLSIVETLLMLENVIDVNWNGDGTALMMAASEGHTAVVELLLKTKGIDVNVIEHSTGGNALQAAAVLGYDEIVRQLLAIPGIDTNQPSNEGFSPLMLAVRGGRAEVVSLLLNEDSVDINAIDNAGDNALTMALSASRGDIASSLLKSAKMVDPNHKNNAGFTPLMICSLLGLVSSVDDLLHNNVDVNIKGNDGWTSLLYAIVKGHTNITKLLLTVPDIDVDAECAQGWTATSLATHLQHSDMIEALEEVETAY